MAWTVTADVGRFDEAADFFQKRVPGVDTGVAADRARGNAFRVAGMLELGAVQLVFDEIAKAVEKGTTLEAFKASVREKLANFSPAGPHLETVFRNWVQGSYNAGRWFQMKDPDVVQIRPYFLYDSILDQRTTEVCKVCNGTIKWHDDHWWLTHWPPLHHRCRSSVRSLRRSEALKRGVTEGDPATDVPGTFGKAPPVRDDEALTTPKAEDHDAAVWAEFQRKQALMQEELRKAEEAARKLRPQHWFDEEYQAKYGDNAGRAVAWGRAMEERGKLVAFDEAKRQHAELTDAAGITFSRLSPLFSRVARAQSDGTLPKGLKTLGELLDALEREAGAWDPEVDEVRALAALLGQRASVTATPLKMRVPRFDRGTPAFVKEQAPETLGKVKQFFEMLTDKVVQHADKARGYVVKFSPNRSKFSTAERLVLARFRLAPNGTLFDAGGGEVAHEMSHGIEFLNEWALEAASQFLSRRTIGEPAKPLFDLMLARGHLTSYSADEIAREDRFYSPYMGKEYVYQGRTYATEVTSMAMQAIYEHAAQLMREDREAFYFALGQLAGAPR